MQSIRPKYTKKVSMNNIPGSNKPIIKSNYQRKMELQLLKGDKSVARCPNCSLYYKRSASSNLCRKCR